MLKTNNIAQLKRELKSILSEITSNKIKGTYIINWYNNCDPVFTVSHFHIDIEGKCGWIIVGGGGKGYVGLLPSKIIARAGGGGGVWPHLPPLPTPMQ